MIDSIETIISRANSLLQSKQGFRGCRLHATHYVLAYEFETGQEAELFKSQQIVNASSIGHKYQIDDSQSTIVLEYRQHSDRHT